MFVNFPISLFLSKIELAAKIHILTFEKLIYFLSIKIGELWSLNR